MKKLKLTLLLVAISISTQAQTIINAERLVGVDSTIYALNLNYAGTRGNLNTDRLGVAPSMIFIRGNNDIKLLGGYTYLQSRGSNILHNAFIHLRHNYNINDRLKTIGYYQIQFNDMLLLTNPQVIGAGLRYQIVDKQNVEFDMGGSLMREYEKLNEEKVTPGEQIETRYTRLGMLTSLGFNVGPNVRVHNVLYYQPYLGDFSDFRLLSDLSLSVNIIKHFDLVTSLTTRYDSDPPDPLVRFDNLLAVGITMKF